MEKYIPLFIGIGCFISGVIMYHKSLNKKHYEQSLIIAWLLMSIFPVFIIFSFFPESQIKGKMFNFSFGGAIGAFLIIWKCGLSKTVKVVEFNRIKEENVRLKQVVNSSGDSILTSTEKILFSVNRCENKKIGLITGTISNVKNIDIWVNSENTNMQMSRFYEESISANIRYLGATKDNVGNVTKDTIFELLKIQVGENVYIHPGSVLVTEAGELNKSNGVKKIFHVASVQGEVGAGYVPVKNIHNCIKNALQKFDELGFEYESILFPLLGTGRAKGSILDIGDRLFESAISYFEHTPKTKLKEIYFLTFTDIQLKTCLEILDKKNSLKKKMDQRENLRRNE